jgi:hypothetical protein
MVSPSSTQDSFLRLGTRFFDWTRYAWLDYSPSPTELVYLDWSRPTGHVFSDWTCLVRLDSPASTGRLLRLDSPSSIWHAFFHQTRVLRLDSPSSTCASTGFSFIDWTRYFHWTRVGLRLDWPRLVRLNWLSSTGLAYCEWTHLLGLDYAYFDWTGLRLF